MCGPFDREETGSLEAEVDRFFRTLTPPAAGVVVAVSGGPDSTALLHALACLPGRSFPLHAAHVNHHLRGAASEGDATWVRSYCAELGVPLSLLDGALDPAHVRREGVESAARAVRYELLSRERDRLESDCVATGHTRSDQAETVLLRLLTGRGAWRLSGIRPVTSDRVIRPLLRVPRADVRRHLVAHGIEPRLDESNDDSRFLRNRIRNELLPMVTLWNPRIEEMLAGTADLEQDRARAFEELLSPIRANLVRSDPASASIESRAGTPPHVLRGLILEQVRRLDPSAREVDASALAEIANAAPGSSRMLSPILRATREDGFIHLQALPPHQDARPYSHPIAPGDTIRVPEAGYSISIREGSAGGPLASEDRRRQVIQLPDESRLILLIRNRRPGDRFRPLGMDRDKNLADFLIDRRIPVEERDALPLLVCNDSIAWIAGVEVSDEFRVRPEAGRRLEIVAERIGGRR